MSEPLCDLSGGSIRTSPLAAILIEALRARVSGELRVDANGGTSRIYLRGGQPCGAQIFFGFRSLGQFLLELGWIDIDALDRSLAAVADGKKQGQALLDIGALDEERLKVGLSLHQQSHIRTLAALEEGSYGLSPQQKLPAWTDEIRISAHRCILDALAAPPGRVVAERILARLPPGQGLKLRDGWEKFAGHFQLEPPELELASRLARPQRPETLAASGHPAAERALPLSAAFFFMGLAVPAAPGSAPTPVPQARTAGNGAAVFSAPVEETRAMTSPILPPAARVTPIEDEPIELEVATPAETAQDRMARLMAAQQREVEQLEAARRAAEEESRRIREEREEAARRAKEAALKAPPPQFKSDEAAARERRARMLKRAFGNIPGGLRMPNAQAAPEPAPAAAPPPPEAPAVVGLKGEEAKQAKVIEDRHAKIAKEDYFARLGLTPNATRDQIKQAFFQAAKLYHPDKVPPALSHLTQKLKDLFAAVNEAYEVLQDDERRKAYVAELKRRQASGGLSKQQEEELKVEIAKGDVAMKRRDWVEAERAYRAAAALADRPDLLAHAAWAVHSDPARGGEASKAKGELEALARKFPNAAPAHYYLGVIARVDGNVVRAEKHFKDAIAANPKHTEANQELRLLQHRKAKG